MNGSHADYRVVSVRISCIEYVVQLLIWDAEQGAGQAGVAFRLQLNASMIAKRGNRAAMLQTTCCPNGQIRAYTHKE